MFRYIYFLVSAEMLGVLVIFVKYPADQVKTKPSPTLAHASCVLALLCMKRVRDMRSVCCLQLPLA
jgi:hypothetical protein